MSIITIDTHSARPMAASSSPMFGLQQTDISFSVPPHSPMHPNHPQLRLDIQSCYNAPQALAAVAAPPAIISLGEEFTDETLPEHSSSSAIQEDDPRDYLSPMSSSSTDDDYQSPISPDAESPYLPFGHNYYPRWQEEHARLLHLHDAVLGNEREARNRELFLETEVARIKDDLARARQRRFASPWTSTPPAASSQFCNSEEEQEETVLSTILTEAREARAEERQNRKRQRERIRELVILLTLGSETRKWEERLAWTASASPSASNNNKRSSRSWSFPSFSSSTPPPPAQHQQIQRTPSLPSLASSPLWKVSAEMILRRREKQISTAGHGRRSSSSTSSPCVTSAPTNSFRQYSATSSAIPYSVPPSTLNSCSDRAEECYPIGGVSAPTSISKPRTLPAKPSLLKLAFTRDDLLREEEEAAAAAAASAVRQREEDERVRQLETEDDKMDIDYSDSSSSEESDSGDSAKSSSEDSDNHNNLVGKRRGGKARFSWRKSLTLGLSEKLKEQLKDLEMVDAE